MFRRNSYACSKSASPSGKPLRNRRKSIECVPVGRPTCACPTHASIAMRGGWPAHLFFEQDGLAGSYPVMTQLLYRGLDRRRGRCNRRCIARTHLHRLRCVAYDAPVCVINRWSCPIAAGGVNRLSISWVDDVSGWPRGDDGARNDRASNHTGSDAGSPISAAPSPAPPPISGSVGCRQAHRNGRNRERTSERLLHQFLPSRIEVAEPIIRQEY